MHLLFHRFFFFLVFFVILVALFSSPLKSKCLLKITLCMSPIGQEHKTRNDLKSDGGHFRAGV